MFPKDHFMEEEFRVSPTEYSFYNLINNQRIGKTPLSLSLKLMNEAAKDFTIIPKTQKPILVSGFNRSEFKGYLDPMQFGTADGIVFLACQDSSFYQRLTDSNSREVGISIKKFKSGRIFFSVIVEGMKSQPVKSNKMLEDQTKPNDKFKQIEPGRKIYTISNIPKIKSLNIVINSPRSGQFKDTIFDSIVKALKIDKRKYYPNFSKEYSDYTQIFMQKNPGCKNIQTYRNYMRSRIAIVDAIPEMFITTEQPPYINTQFAKHVVRSSNIMEFLDNNPYNFIAIGTADTDANIIFAWIAIGFDPNLPVLDIHTLAQIPLGKQHGGTSFGGAPSHASPSPSPVVSNQQKQRKTQNQKMDFKTKTNEQKHDYDPYGAFRPYIPKTEPTFAENAKDEVKRIISTITSHFSVQDIAAKAIETALDNALFNISPTPEGLAARVNEMRVTRKLPKVLLDEGGMMDAAQFYADSWAVLEPEDIDSLVFSPEDLGELCSRRPVCVRIPAARPRIDEFEMALETDGNVFGEFATVSVAYAIDSESSNPICVVIFAQ